MTWTETEFERLFDRLYPSVIRFLRGLSGDSDLAHDLAQEAFLRLHKAGGEVLSVDGARYWVFRVAHNLAINALKRRARGRKIAEQLARLVGRHAPSPEERSAQREQAGLQWALVHALPAGQRAALLLREQEGLSYAEIARTLAVTESKIKVDIHRARMKLRHQWSRNLNKRTQWTVNT